VPIIVMKAGNKFLKKTKFVLLSGVKLSLRIQVWALKNARGSALSASPALRVVCFPFAMITFFVGTDVVAMSKTLLEDEEPSF